MKLFESLKNQAESGGCRPAWVEEAEEEPDMIAISMEYVPGGSITYLLQFFKSFKEPLVKIYINFTPNIHFHTF